MIFCDPERAFHESLNRFFTRARCSNDCNDCIDVAHCIDKSFETMRLLSRLAKLEFRAATDHCATMIDVARNQIAEGERSRLAIDQRNIHDAVCRLQRREFVQLAFDDSWICSLAKHNQNARLCIASRMISHIDDVWNSIVFLRINNALDENALHHLIGNLFDDDHVASVFRLVTNTTTHSQPSTTCGIRLGDSATSNDRTSRWEIRSRHKRKKSIQSNVWIIDRRHNRIGNFAKIVRRHCTCHTNSNSRRSVHKKIWKLAWKNHRLHQAIVIIWLEIYSFFVEIFQHRNCDASHSSFGISHRCGWITFNRSKVSLLVDQQCARLPRLTKIHKRWIDDGLTVRVIISACVAANLCAFDLLATRRKI